MGYTIKIGNSGRSFIAERGDTLLDAALRSGITLRCGCHGGSCGDCKARVVSGELAETHPHDYPLSEVEKGLGMVLLCCAVPGSDMEIEAGEISSPRDIPRQRIATKLVKPQRIGEVLLFQLRTPRSQRLQFLPGQHLQLRFENGATCDLPIASCPCNGMVLQFHYPCRDDDPLASYLCGELKQGDTVEIEGPYGEITLDGDSRRPLLMVAEGSGFAPIKSLLEQAINLEMAQPIELYWLAEQGGHYLDNLCRSWVDALDSFDYHPLAVAGEEGAEAIAGLVAAMASPVHDIYCAGSATLQRELKRQLTQQRQGIDNLWLLNPRGESR